MGIFDKLFGRKKEDNTQPKKINTTTEQPEFKTEPSAPVEEKNDTTDKQVPTVKTVQPPAPKTPPSYENEFQEAVLATLPRYLSNPGKEYTNEMISDNGAPMDFKALFPEEFESWNNAESPWDERSIIYSVCDKAFGESLRTWQLAERLIDDRYPDKALKALSGPIGDLTANICASFSKAYVILGHNEDALEWAKKGMQLDPSNLRINRAYADALYINKQYDAAIEKYYGISDMAMAEKKEKGIDKNGYDFYDTHSFDGNMVFSPFFASISLIELNANLDEWEWAGNEFYYSPHFRAQHAYELLANDEPLHALTKLTSLTQEMPWFKEGVINCLALLNKLDEDNKYTAEREELSKMIEENQWTTEDMFVLQLD